MFIRFTFALIVVVAASAAGIALGKRLLELRRGVSHQSYQLDVQLDQHAPLRLRTQQLGVPLRLLDAIEAGRLHVEPANSAAPPRGLPACRTFEGF